VLRSSVEEVRPGELPPPGGGARLYETHNPAVGGDLDLGVDITPATAEEQGADRLAPRRWSADGPAGRAAWRNSGLSVRWRSAPLWCFWAHLPPPRSADSATATR
jgi:hypothetical protein